MVTWYDEEANQCISDGGPLKGKVSPFGVPAYMLDMLTTFISSLEKSLETPVTYIVETVNLLHIYYILHSYYILNIFKYIYYTITI